MNRFQKILEANYALGGDTLYLFLHQELEDVEDVDTAVQRLHSAMNDIQVILDAMS